MFLAGDMIFYPLHGVGQITRIREDGGYEIYLAEEAVNVKVSQKGADVRKLRYPLKKKEFFHELEAAKRINDKSHLTWRQQRQNYEESLKSGEVRKVATVIRCLEEKAEEKPLSATEIRMLHLARQIIQSEIRFILDIDEKKAKELLANFMNY